mgnify:CR=1 FL=1
MRVIWTGSHARETWESRVRAISVAWLHVELASVRANVRETALVFGRHLFWNARKRLGRLCREVKVKDLRFHDLRHSFASLALEAGVPLVVVQQMLGHASITMTANVYSHVGTSLQQQAVSAFEALLRAEPP